jgi:hypothetical protein
MIKYSLTCDAGHEFEGWFKSSAAFDVQAKKKQITCAICGSSTVSKAIMAPRIASGSPKAKAQPDAIGQLRALREKVVANAEYVGHRFADEARKIHYDEAGHRGIYGEATHQEAKDLVDEGISVFPLPALPEDKN